MNDLGDLIARLEKASEPDRELDAEIALHNGWKVWRSKHGYWNIEWKKDGMDCHTQTCVDPFGPRFDPDTGKKNERFDSMPLNWAWNGDVPEFTNSIDAALTLIPEGWSWDCGKESYGEPSRGAWARCYPRQYQERGTGNFWGKTPAIALCIAALRSK